MRNERGAALITVMFLITMASILAFGLLSRQQLDVRRTGGMLDEAQAYQYALGAEEWSRQVLAYDAALSPGVDYPGQHWAQLHSAMPVEHGFLTLSIEDLQGRFNINTLVGNNRVPTSQFRRLLSVLNMPPDLATAFSARISAPENTDPVTHTPRYIPSVAFLRTVDGVTPEIYASLAPYLSALPDNRTTLNVNTASDTVLKAFFPNERLYDLFIKSRAQNGFFNQRQLHTMGMTGPTFGSVQTRGMGVGSNYFGVTIEAEVEGHGVTLKSVIARSTDKTGAMHLRVIRRDRSPVY